MKRVHDIALIRISDFKLNLFTQPIPLCTEYVSDRVLLGACGMGSTTVENDKDCSQVVQVGTLLV